MKDKPLVSDRIIGAAAIVVTILILASGADILVRSYYGADGTASSQK